MAAVGQSATPTFATGMEEVASIADAGWASERLTHCNKNLRVPFRLLAKLM
jgi:hypothetical protein